MRVPRPPYPVFESPCSPPLPSPFLGASGLSTRDGEAKGGLAARRNPLLLAPWPARPPFAGFPPLKPPSLFTTTLNLTFLSILNMVKTICLIA